MAKISSAFVFLSLKNSDIYPSTSTSVESGLKDDNGLRFESIMMDEQILCGKMYVKQRRNSGNDLGL